MSLCCFSCATKSRRLADCMLTLALTRAFRPSSLDICMCVCVYLRPLSDHSLQGNDCCIMTSVDRCRRNSNSRIRTTSHPPLLLLHRCMHIRMPRSPFVATQGVPEGSQRLQQKAEMPGKEKKACGGSYDIQMGGEL